VFRAYLLAYVDGRAQHATLRIRAAKGSMLCFRWARERSIGETVEAG
jgi:hypothetical protein